MPDAEPLPGALSALRILDLSTGIATTHCTKLFADYVAEVVKGEIPGTGDVLLRSGPFPEDTPDTERGVTPEVTKSVCQSILQRLLPHFDIFMDSFPPEHTTQLPVSYETPHGRRHACTT